jgi:hypothetical protein
VSNADSYYVNMMCVGPGCWDGSKNSNDSSFECSNNKIM